MQSQRFLARRSASVSMIALCLGAILPLSAAQVTGVPNFYRVDEHLYRGGQPSSEGFRCLAEMGVRTVIDLRQIGEHSQKQEKAWVESNGMRYVSVPMRGMSAPTNSQVTQVLAILNDPAAGPVF